MNKKGFTLMEMLGVIIILSLLMVLVFPNIVNSVRNSTYKTNKVTENLVSTALDLYVNEKGYDISNSYFCISLQELINEGYLKKPVKYDDLDDISAVKSVFKYKDSDVSFIDNGECLTTILMNQGEKSGVFEDPAGNIRFRGKKPNNYITFNDELWRIIGYIDGRLKIMSENSIKDIQWDDEATNDWINSSLQGYLNGEYYNNIKEPYNMMLNKSSWNIGIIESDDMDNPTIDTMENLIRKENVLTFESYIALMNLSDYGYSADKTCKENLYNYDSCSDSNWIFNGEIQWLLNSTSTDVYTISDDGTVNYNVSFNKFSVRPVVNLLTDIKVVDGIGTKNDPYILAL